MITLVCKQELEKQLGHVTMQEWNWSIEKFGNELNIKYRHTPSKEEQLDKISTYIDVYRRHYD